MTPKDGLPIDIARRLAGGENADLSAEGDKSTEEAAPLRAPDLPPPPPPPPRKRDDRYIGDFRLVRKLGEGGMGVVYEAEQQHPHRPVALKVIRGGAHVTDDTLKLFQREAQTLAHLRHPASPPSTRPAPPTTACTSSRWSWCAATRWATG